MTTSHQRPESTPIYELSLRPRLDTQSSDNPADEMRNSGRSSSFEMASSDYNLNRKIFVGNVSYRIGSRKLSKFFQKFGDVEYCYIVKDHLRKWSRGIAFVTFKTEEAMNKALQASEEQLFFDGRQMRVKPAELSNKTSFWQDKHRAAEETYTSSDEEENDALSHLNMEAANSNNSSHPDPPLATTCHIDVLLDEMMIKIFSFLSVRERLGIERVCWRWKHLVQRTWSSLKTLHFQNMFRRFEGLTDKSLNSVLSRCGRYLERLDLSASPRLLTDFAMDVIGKHCEELAELDISNVKITNISLKNLVARCKTLKWVRLKSCLYIGDKGLQDLFAGSEHLEYIDLSHLSQVTGKSFGHLCKRVKVLVLEDCFKITDKSIQKLCSRTGDSLQELYLSNCRLLTGDGITALCRGLQRLKKLHICGTAVHSSSESYTHLEKLHNLEELNLSLNLHIEDRVLIGVAQHCKQLRVLDISGCHQGVTDTGVIALTKLPHLHSLSLSYLNKVSEHSIILLSHTLQLEKFVARATQFITDEVVISLVNNCPRLYHLDLSGCFQITNRIFEAFKDGSSVDNVNVIVELHLGGTSVDMESDHYIWTSQLTNVKVSLQNLAMEQLRPDRDIILPGEEDFDSEEEEGQQGEPRVALQALQSGNIADFEDNVWEEDFGDDDDDFLYNDDPLEAERWDLS